MPVDRIVSREKAPVNRIMDNINQTLGRGNRLKALRSDPEYKRRNDERIRFRYNRQPNPINKAVEAGRSVMDNIDTAVAKSLDAINKSIDSDYAKRIGKSAREWAGSVDDIVSDIAGEVVERPKGCK